MIVCYATSPNQCNKSQSMMRLYKNWILLISQDKSDKEKG